MTARNEVRPALIRAVGKALWNWGDEEPNEATGFIARYEAERIADMLPQCLDAVGLEITAMELPTADEVRGILAPKTGTGR